jgi:asparagine synthase (glutamine-hydrolysing)
MKKRHLVASLTRWAPSWQKDNNAWIKGFGYKDNKPVRKKALLDALQESKKAHVSGQYAAVIETETEVHLIVDALATIPLFFSINDSGIHVADSIPYAGQGIDGRALNEFYWFGFVSGEKTLYQDWLVVEADTHVVINKETGRHTRHTQDAHIVKEKIIDLGMAEELALEAIHQNFHRFVQELDNRPILIPLSGGRDARLIAVLAKEYGLNVQAYSYGRDGSFEVNRAKNVAQYLNIPFHHVRLSPESWSCFHDADIQSFLDHSFSGTATPQLIEAVTIKQLRKQIECDPRTLIVPGHSGDLLGGSHIPALGGKAIYSEQDIVASVIAHHGRFMRPSKQDMPFIKEMLSAQFTEGEYTEFGYVEACEIWNIKNRQSKFILGAAKAYEWAGFEWRVPLWDTEFEKVWRSLPLKYREGNRLYNRVLDEHFFKPYDINFPEHVPITKSPIVKAIRGLIPQTIYEEMRHRLKSLRRERVDYNAYQWLNDLLLKELPDPLPYSKREDHALLTAWLVQVFLGRNTL